jgi:RHS repeat-associated protein
LFVILAFCSNSEAQITATFGHSTYVVTNYYFGDPHTTGSTAAQENVAYEHLTVWNEIPRVRAKVALTANDAVTDSSVDFSGVFEAATTECFPGDGLPNGYGPGLALERSTDSDRFTVTEPVYYTCTSTINAIGSPGGFGSIPGGYVILQKRSEDGQHFTRVFLMGTGFLDNIPEPHSPPGAVSGILPAGEYWLDAVAVCGGGIFYPGGNGSASNTFRFQAETLSPPTATTLPVSNVTQRSAVLNGTVDPNGHTVTAQFEYGLAGSPTYAGSISVPVTEGIIAQSVSATLGDLMPDTLYRYRLVAQSEGDTISGGDILFILPISPPAENLGWDDHTPKPPPCESTPNPRPSPTHGMATYDFHTKLASLKITDTPVGYTPPYGYPIPLTVTYTQRTTSQPATFDYCNLGPKWNINWLTYITDDPNDATSVSGQARPSGGTLPVVYLGADATHHRYQLVGKPGMQLRRPLASALPLEILNADGSKEVYGQPDGHTTVPRKIFLTQRIDPQGNATTLTYDASMRLTKITDALGQETTLEYTLPSDPLKITKVTDPFGRFATFGYNDAGRLVSITDVIGIQSTFTYEGGGDFINSLTTPYGTTTFANTEIGTIRRITATDPAGDTEVLESNEAETAVIPASDPANLIPQGVPVLNAQLNTRNSFYWDKKQWKEAPNDYTRAHIYHWLKNLDATTVSGYLESEKPPLQSRVWYSYPDQADPQIVGAITTPSKVGRVIEGGTQLVSRSITPLGKFASETDPLGRTTNYQYSADGIDLLNFAQVVAGSPRTLATIAYNDQRRPLTVTGANGNTAFYGWNARGQMISSKNERNETTAYSYYTEDEAGMQRKARLATIDGPLSGDADSVNLDYDATGNLARVTGPDGYFLRFAYDALDRLTRVTFPDETYTETTYLALDPQISRDRLERLTHYVYNSLRQLISVTDPAQRETQYHYCDCGALDQLIDPMNRITNWHHDIAGRLTAKVYDDGSAIQYAYEPLSGRLSAITDEKNQVKTRSYNLDNTLAGITYTNAEHYTPNVAFTYDLDFRRLKTMVDGIGTTTYDYYPINPGTLGAGQLASVDGPLPDEMLTYTYDELGRNTGYAINGVGETRTFDLLGRLLSVVNPLGTFDYTYVGATGRMDKVTYPNGMTCQYNYHPLTGDFRLKDIVHTLPGDTLLSRHSYEYNSVGNIMRWTQISPQASLNRSWLCGYDDADQLTSVTSQDPDTLANLPTGQYAYTYDPAGNRLTETIDGVTATANFNALNQLVGLDTGGSATLPQQAYEWDAEDRLVAISYIGSNERSEFEYDGYGRRLGVREKRGNTVIDYRRFAWRGFQIAEERDISGSAVQKRYFERGMQIFEGGALDPRMFSHDHLGSVRELISTDAQLTNSFDFDPWGRRTLSVGQSDESSLAFTGHWLHAKSRLVMAQYRHFQTDSGRWSSRDLLGESIRVNLYQYSLNNPTTYLDPLGLTCEPFLERWRQSLSRSGKKIFEVAKGVKDLLLADQAAQNALSFGGALGWSFTIGGSEGFTIAGSAVAEFALTLVDAQGLAIAAAAVLVGTGIDAAMSSDCSCDRNGSLPGDYPTDIRNMINDPNPLFR